MGCHTAKFLNEQDSEKVRDAILKYEIKHPVINDDKRICWRNFERRSWPGLIVLGPAGFPILILSGEGHRALLDLFLSVAYDFYYDKLNHEARIPWALEESKTAKSTKKESRETVNAKKQNLRYPGRVLCIEQQTGLKNNLLVIADSANNRLVLINEETMTCTGVIGNGRIGLVDGNYEEA